VCCATVLIILCFHGAGCCLQWQILDTVQDLLLCSVELTGWNGPQAGECSGEEDEAGEEDPGEEFTEEAVENWDVVDGEEHVDVFGVHLGELWSFWYTHRGCGVVVVVNLVIVPDRTVRPVRGQLTTSRLSLNVFSRYEAI
jgi:hypothetical protein